MHDVGGKLLNGIKSMYINSLDESERFRSDSGVRLGRIMSRWLFNVYIDTVMEVQMGVGGWE